MDLYFFLQWSLSRNTLRPLITRYFSQDVDLGVPFHVQHYQTEPGKPGITNNTIFSSFTGEGTINGTVNITAEWNSTETFRNNATSYIQGKAQYATDDNGIAAYDFYAIGIYHPDGSFGSIGAVIFDDGATGELSFLSNSVGIYKDIVDKNGNGISYVALEIGMGEEIRSIGKIWIRSRFNDLQIVWIL